MKAIRICKMVGLGICLFGIMGSLRAFQPAQTGVVEVLQEGKIRYTFDLSQQRFRRRIVISSEEGENVILVGPEGVCVESADCADGICVEMGYLKSAALPIVCLPHRLTIRYANQDEIPEVDGATH